MICCIEILQISYMPIEGQKIEEWKCPNRRLLLPVVFKGAYRHIIISNLF